MADDTSGLLYSTHAVRAFQKPVHEVLPAELNPAALRAARQFQDGFITPRMLSGIWRLTEFASLASLGFAVFALYVGLQSGLALRYAGTSLFGALAGVLAIELADGYLIAVLRSRGAQMWRVAMAWGVAIALVALALFLLKEQDTYSRVWLATWFASGLTLLGLARLIIGANIRRWARNGVMERRAIIVGGGAGAESLLRGLEMQPESDVRICGIFDDRDDSRSPPIVAGYPKLGTVRELVEFARQTRIDMLIVTLPLSAEKRVLSLLKELWVLPLDIRLSAHSAELRFRPRSYSFIGQIPLLDVFDRPLADWDWIAKRAFDLVVASLALIVLSPVLLATAVLIRLESKGPVLFKQQRHGFNNQIVDVFKFRSLYHEMADPAALKVVTKDDPRVTRVGKFIRKTSIDELPQLINVIRGELSLVGPRPHAVQAISTRNETFIEIVDGYFGRHKVKPGITGWAQINGWRGTIDQPEKLRKRFEHDLYYIENWSILLDLYILLMTPISLIKTENAY